MTFYIYRFGAADIPQKLPSGTGLTPLLVGALQVLEVAIVFPASLPTDDKQALDNFMSDRQFVFYQEKPGAATFHASTKVLEGEAALNGGWKTLGGVVTDPSTFAKTVAKVFGQITGGVQSVGLGAELRMVQTDDAGVDTVLGTIALPDTVGAWVTFQGFTNVPPTGGLNSYRVEGRLNGATSASVRFVSATLLESL